MGRAQSFYLQIFDRLCAQVRLGALKHEAPDALAVGLSLALLDVNVVGAAMLIGGVSAGLSLVGLTLGNQLGIRFGKTMEVIGGIILIGIGLRVLITHLFG
jgi:putative Mn2+ efflux pump MntP